VDLRLSLDVPEKYTWHDTKKRALDPAIEEIAQHSGLEITYEVIKTGRSVTALNIKIKEIEQMKLPL
jgi:plasmid replication initiation protein